MLRPQSIRRFEILYLVALVLGAINTVLTFNQLSTQLSADPNTAAAAVPIMIGSLVIGVAIQLLLWFFVARKGSNVARWILVVLFVLGLLSLVWTLVQGTYPGGLVGALGLVSWVLQLVAVFMLFRPDAARWFRGEDRTDPAAPFE